MNEQASECARQDLASVPCRPAGTDHSAYHRHGQNVVSSGIFITHARREHGCVQRHTCTWRAGGERGQVLGCTDCTIRRRAACHRIQDVAEHTHGSTVATGEPTFTVISTTSCCSPMAAAVSATRPTRQAKKPPIAATGMQPIIATRFQIEHAPQFQTL